MGVINIKSRSFYAQSEEDDADRVIERIAAMVKAGASFIDIGGQSTNPLSIRLSAEEEWANLAPIIPQLSTLFPRVLFSIDTFYSSVAQKAYDCGFHMINDVSGGGIDDNMFRTAKRLQVPYILTHIKGTPQSMTSHISENDIIAETMTYFTQQIHHLEQLGVHDIVLDVGIGFGKSVRQNFQLLKNLHLFQVFRKPLLIGLSRKSLIYKTLDIKPEEALNGTTVLHTLAVLNGAHLIRVHDVAEAQQCLTLLDAYHGA